MKKILSLILLISILFGTFAGINITANAVTLYWPVPGHRSLSQGFHDGNAIDISDGSIAGAKVITALGGTVIVKYTCAQQHYGSMGDCNGFGTGIVIRGTDGRTYQYAHMQANSIPSNVYVGATVNAGQEVGKVGTTGNSSGNHLHFAIAFQNYWEAGVNPLNETYNYSDGNTHKTHTWDKGKVTTQATCTSDGVKTYTCTVCGETKTETIKGGHKYKVIGRVRATFLVNGAVGRECTVCGNRVKTIVYRPKSVVSNKSKVTYNGKYQYPGVTVKDIKGNVISPKYYTRSYKNNLNAGIAVITVNFKGLYSGTKSVAFKIAPKGNALRAVKTAGYSAINVYWNKQTIQTGGYQIQYSTDSKFSKNNKSFTVKTKTSGKKVTGLKSGTKYYFRIRTYKKALQIPVYSGWSKVISAKTATPPPTWVKPLNYSWSYHGHNLFATSEKYGKYYCYIDREWPYYNSGDSSEYYYLYKYTSATADPQKIYISKSYDDIIDSTLTDGNGNVYYAKYQWGGYGTVYRITDNGETSKIFTAKNLTKITGIYGGNIYYLKEILGSEGIEDVHFCKYSIKTKKSSTIKKKAWNLYSNTDTKGRYMLFEWYSQNYSYGTQITLFDAKTGKFYKITTNGRNSHFSGSKIYYLSGMRDKNPKAKVIYCDLNGKNKKTVYQLWLEYEPFCTSSKCMYFYKYLGGGHNNYDFYAYIFKTKKFVMIDPYRNYIVDIQ